MIGLQQKCGINLEGIIRIEFAKVNEILNADIVIHQGNQMQDVQFKQGASGWVPALFLPKKDAWKETSHRSNQGLSYKQRLSGVLPGISREITEKITELENHQFIIRIKSSSNWILLGTRSAPFELSTELNTTAPKGHKITFSATTRHKSYNFEPNW